MSNRNVLTIVVCGILWPLLVSAAPAAEGPAWQNLAEGVGADRPGGVLFWAAEMKKAIWVGPAGEEKPQPCVRVYDPDQKTWSTLAATGPAGRGFHPYYQAIFDPGSACVFCLSGGNVLYRFNVNDKAWTALPPAPELEGLSWHVMAADGAGKIVVIGSDKKADNIGWTRTAIYDIAADKWSLLPLPSADVVQAHRHLVALKEAVIDLGGYTRLAWYRDPAGEGTQAERQALVQRCAAIKKMDQAENFAAAGVDAVAELIGKKQLLDALKATRELQRKIEETAERQYPVPCSRRNSPLAYDPKNKVYVLFGGDHEDYLMNDTWVLDPAKGWRRAAPKSAPSPRGGHALIGLAGGGVLLCEGYLQATGTDYGSRPYSYVLPVQTWRYDPAGDRWDLLGSWTPPKQDGDAVPPPVGHFYGYASQYFSPPALAEVRPGQLLLAAQPARTWYLGWKNFPARVWSLDLSAARADEAGAAQLAQPPNQRLYRGGIFSAAFCEVADPPKPTGLDELPENRWVRLPAPPRNPLSGCRQRDWGTCVWDGDREQILHWGGGHCVRSDSPVAHYSPVSGRVVEGFDADEPYGANGGGGFDSSILNRPWVGPHNYNHYCYDPKCKMLVSGRGYLYDPSRMDWVRMERFELPYEFNWGSTVLEGSPHGTVAWARRKNSEWAGLWLLDREKGWSELEQGDVKKLFAPYCDSHGMVYDSKRDRMVLGGVGATYGKIAGGKLMAYDFKARTLQTITPENLPAGAARNSREMAYVDHADWILIGSHHRAGDKEKGKPYTRVYDCGKNKYFLLDAGEVADGHSCGWMYDAKRKLAYVFSFRGEAWAMKINPQTAKLVETAE